MAYARIVTIGKGTVIKTVLYKTPAPTTGEVDRAATALESIIMREGHILKVEVNYDGCDDSLLR